MKRDSGLGKLRSRDQASNAEIRDHLRNLLLTGPLGIGRALDLRITAGLRVAPVALGRSVHAGPRNVLRSVGNRLRHQESRGRPRLRFGSHKPHLAFLRWPLCSCEFSSEGHRCMTITESGMPMSTSGQGFPTPRRRRSRSLFQCVVADPNLSATILFVQASTKVDSAPLSIFLCCRGVSVMPNLPRSSKLRKPVNVGTFADDRTHVPL